MVYDPWGIFPSKNTICVSWVCNILRRNNMVWFFCTLVAFQVIMWKSKEFEDIWWCKNQINIRCQSGFGRGYNHCDRYVTVKAEKYSFDQFLITCILSLSSWNYLIGIQPTNTKKLPKKTLQVTSEYKKPYWFYGKFQNKRNT